MTLTDRETLRAWANQLPARMFVSGDEFRTIVGQILSLLAAHEALEAHANELAQGMRRLRADLAPIEALKAEVAALKAKVLTRETARARLTDGVLRKSDVANVRANWAAGAQRTKAGYAAARNVLLDALGLEG